MSRYASREAQDAEQALRDVQARLEGNNYCADCGHPRPEYINLTIGTFICQLCCDIHRNISNRRIKDMYAGELTMDDVRRMESVGNDVANRKFLATWNTREVPQPDRRDKDSLHEFLWLKYDGSFKKQRAPQAQPPQPPASSRDYRSDDRYYDDRIPQERVRDLDLDRGGYRREQDLFRESSQQNPDRPRSYWASRYDTSRPLQPPPGRLRDDYYRHGPSPGPPYPDRYRSGVPSDRFQPPQPTPVVPYGRVIRNARARYQEQGLPYEEYASITSEDRDEARRRVATSQSRRKTSSSQDYFGYSDGDGDIEQSYRKSKSSKEKGRTRRRKSAIDEVGNSYYSEGDDGDVEEVEARRVKKNHVRKSKKSGKESKSKRRTVEEDEEEEYDEEEEDYEDGKRAAGHGSGGRRSKRAVSKKIDRQSERDRESVVTASGDGLEDGTNPNNTPGQPAKAEFDLMSEWMGDSKETDGSHGTATGQGAGSPSGGPIPAAMQQAYATAQMPMMAPPMSVYGGMMPVPGGGFMPMMAPGFVPGMGIPGMPPGMPPGMAPGMPPGMPSGVPPGMLGMPGGPGIPGPQPMPPMQGMVNGLQNLSMNQPVPQGANQAPPPPPVGMPAGPAPGPPPEPPQ